MWQNLYLSKVSFCLAMKLEGRLLLRGWALAAGPRLIPVFTKGKGSVHEENAEYILGLCCLSLAPAMRN